MTYVSVNEQLFPATITGRLHDDTWDNRSSKAITLEMSYEEALHLFVDDVDWAIVDVYTHEETVIDEDGEEITELKEDHTVYDNSDYSIAGDIIDHRDGYVTVKMGKQTAEEILAMITEGLAL